MFRFLVKLPFKIISSCLSIILGSLIILVVVFWFYSTVVLKQDFDIFKLSKIRYRVFGVCGKVMKHNGTG